MKIKKYKLVIIVFLIVSVIGFITLGLPSLNGEIEIQTYSDSLTYEKIARYNFSNLLLFDTASNIVGPVFIIKLLNYNYVYIFIMNLLLLLISLHLIFKYYDLNKKVFLFFIFCTPLMFFSLFNINKEMFVLLDIVLFLVYLKNKNYLLFFIVVVIAYFIRWQMALFFILLLPFLFIDTFYKKRLMILILFVGLISIVYPKISYIFQAVIEHGSINNDLVQGAGIFSKLKSIQDIVGGYLLVFIPKLLQINIGMIKRIDMLGNADAFWNYFVLLLHNLMSLLLLLYLFIKRKFTLENKLVYIGMIYAAIFAIAPIVQIRYFLPMYILFVVVASQKKDNKII